MVTSLSKTLSLYSPEKLHVDDGDKVLAYRRGNFIYVFNFHSEKSYEGYGILVPPATRWKHFFDTDEKVYGGFGRIEPSLVYDPSLVFSRGELVQQIKLYLPSRTAIVLRLFPG
jgi:1,4-alpha-glucan branching enzyme